VVKNSRIKDIKALMPFLKGRKVNIFNTLETKDPLGCGTVRGFNNNMDNVVFDDWVWWNGDRVTVNYLSLEVIKKITFKS
jgi:hypothetical protein